MPVDFGKLIIELQTKLTAASDRLVGLREARRPHALAAVSGEAKARKAIAGIDAEVVAVSSEAETLQLALEEAERQKRDAEAKATEEDRQRRIAEARRIAAELHRVCTEADSLMAHLATALNRREELISRLSDTRVVYSGVLNALRRPARIPAALWAAGLGSLFGIEFIPGTRRQPLADADSVRSDFIGGKSVDARSGDANDRKEVAA